MLAPHMCGDSVFATGSKVANGAAKDFCMAVSAMKEPVPVFIDPITILAGVRPLICMLRIGVL